VGPHALFGEEDHDLIELAAGGTDVVVLHRLREVDDAQGIVDLDAVGIQ